MDFPEKPMLTVDETADLLHLSRDSVYRAARDGHLPTVRIGRRVYIATEGLRHLVMAS